MPDDRMLSLFAYAHLPPHLQEVSKLFHDLAHRVVETVPQNPERTIALRHIWDAKNYAVVASGIAAGIPAPKQAT